MGNVIKLKHWMERFFVTEMVELNSAISVFLFQSTAIRQIFICLKNKYSIRQFYDTLYKKPWNIFAVRLRSLCLSGLIGTRFLAIMVSKSGDCCFSMIKFSAHMYYNWKAQNHSSFLFRFWYELEKTNLFLVYVPCYCRIHILYLLLKVLLEYLNDRPSPVKLRVHLHSFSLESQHPYTNVFLNHKGHLDGEDYRAFAIDSRMIRHCITRICCYLYICSIHS